MNSCQKWLKRTAYQIDHTAGEALLNHICRSESMAPYYMAQCAASDVFETAGMYEPWEALNVIWLPLVWVGVVDLFKTPEERPNKRTLYHVGLLLESQTRQLRRESQSGTRATEEKPS